MRLFSALSALLILVAVPDETRAQIGAESIRPGVSSDTALLLLRGQYTAIDTVRVESRFILCRIRLAPVKLAGLDGLLTLDVDSAGSVSELTWSRQPASGYARAGIWEHFTGWDSWQTPTRKETELIQKRIMEDYLQPAQEGELVPTGQESREWLRLRMPARASEAPMDTTFRMRAVWPSESATIYISHGGSMLMVRATQRDLQGQ